MVKSCGWFDERFPGIGYEDHDYEIRMAIKDVIMGRTEIKGVRNIAHQPKDYSWSANEEVIFNKYSRVNGDHYEKKWTIYTVAEKEEPFIPIIQGYARLNEGMETPNFYPDF